MGISQCNCFFLDDEETDSFHPGKNVQLTCSPKRFKRVTENRVVVMANNLELLKDEDVIPDCPPSPIMHSKSVTRSRRAIFTTESFTKLESPDIVSERLLAYHSRVPLGKLAEIAPNGTVAETPYGDETPVESLELPFFPGNSRSPSIGPLPQLRREIPNRSETVDTIAEELMALPDVEEDSEPLNFFEIKKASFRGAKLLEVMDDISAHNSVFTKGQKLEVVEWITEDEIEVQIEKETTRIILQPETLQALRPFGISSVEDLQMFSLPELMECVNTSLRRLFDNNVVEVVKDFIQFRPKYFQEVQNVGGRLPLFPVMASLEFTELSVRFDDSYENKSCHLLENGEVHYEVDENFRGKLPQMDLESWAFVKYKQSWAVVLMTAGKVVREMLDFHEVFQDPTCDVLLPTINSFGLSVGRSASRPGFQPLSSSDLIPDLGDTTELDELEESATLIPLETSLSNNQLLVNCL